MKLIFGGIIFIAALCNFAAAQAVETARHATRHQVTIQAGATFTRKVTDSGITYQPTSSGAGLVGYRYNINRWLGVEGDYDFFRNSQKFIISSSSISLKTNVNVATGSAVINLPNPITKRFKSYASIGGGGNDFPPNGHRYYGSANQECDRVWRWVDFPVAPHIAIRGQAKTLMYKAPDFTTSNLKTSKYVQTMIPSVGVVFSF